MIRIHSGTTYRPASQLLKTGIDLLQLYEVHEELADVLLTLEEADVQAVVTVEDGGEWSVDGQGNASRTYDIVVRGHDERAREALTLFMGVVYDER